MVVPVMLHMLKSVFKSVPGVAVLDKRKEKKEKTSFNI